MHEQLELMYRGGSDMCSVSAQYFLFFFNDTATTEIYTLHIVGSVRCVQETGINAEYMGTKPQPARYFDEHVKNGFGVMADDLVAAGYTLLSLALLKIVFA
eukprot:TRINITY_DN1300_c0_g1_i5.p5 TRINITY_DN1300_c0_g1~~TRINITY_DN1300_c0_g1_i5.p5  ORF type:complete len:101 (-),score=26.21 TRINITY_DN1300_c0_g1_i5:1281-1583(-)